VLRGFAGRAPFPTRKLRARTLEGERPLFIPKVGIEDLLVVLALFVEVSLNSPDVTAAAILHGKKRLGIHRNFHQVGVLAPHPAGDEPPRLPDAPRYAVAVKQCVPAQQARVELEEHERKHSCVRKPPAKVAGDDRAKTGPDTESKCVECHGECETERPEEDQTIRRDEKRLHRADLGSGNFVRSW
jgi:hypothetical protein